MIHRLTFRFIMSLSASALAAMSLPHPAFAATHEQIIAKCREAARPQVVACVRAKIGGRGGDREATIAACRESVGRPIVYACVLREEQKQAGGEAAPAAPKDETAIAPNDAGPVQPTFVAPPRTIADITAILDSEKPDDAKIAERKANADATPPINASAAQLAQFYYDRGAARALLARNKEALADGLQALAVGKGAIEFKQVSRIRQFVALQYRAIGDPETGDHHVRLDRAGGQPTRRARHHDQCTGQHRGDAGFDGRRHPGDYLRGPHRSARSGGARQSEPELAQPSTASTVIPGKPMPNQCAGWCSKRAASMPKLKQPIVAPRRFAAPR